MFGAVSYTHLDVYKRQVYFGREFYIVAKDREGKRLRAVGLLWISTVRYTFVAGNETSTRLISNTLCSQSIMG